MNRPAISKPLLIGIIAGSILLALAVGASLGSDERMRLQHFRELERP